MPRFQILDTRYIPVADITIDDDMIRSVNKKRKGWAEFVTDIKENGVMQPVQAREVEDEETGETKVVLIDGGHRVAAAQEAGLTEIPVAIVEASDDDVLEIQISNNFQRFDTRPAEYAKQLRKILALNPHLTEADLARRVNMSTTYIANRLSLNNLTEDIKTLVDEGNIPLASAYYLAKLPQEEQGNWSERAQTMSVNKFCPECAHAATQLKKPKAQRKEGFEPVAKGRKIADVRNELSNTVAFLKQRNNPVPDENADDYLNGYANGLRYALSLDENSVQAAREEYEAREAEKARKKAEKEAEKLKEGKSVSDELLAAVVSADDE